MSSISCSTWKRYMYQLLLEWSLHVCADCGKLLCVQDLLSFEPHQLLVPSLTSQLFDVSRYNIQFLNVFGRIQKQICLVSPRNHLDAPIVYKSVWFQPNQLALWMQIELVQTAPPCNCHQATSGRSGIVSSVDEIKLWDWTTCTGLDFDSVSTTWWTKSGKF